MKQNIEAEEGELVLKNEKNDIVVIPSKKRATVLGWIKEGLNNKIDSFVSKLPKRKDYAENGTLIPNEEGELTLEDIMGNSETKETKELTLDDIMADDSKKKNGGAESVSEVQSISEDSENIEQSELKLGIDNDFGSFLPEQETTKQSSTRVEQPIQEQLTGLTAEEANAEAKRKASDNLTRVKTKYKSNTTGELKHRLKEVNKRLRASVNDRSINKEIAKEEIAELEYAIETLTKEDIEFGKEASSQVGDIALEKQGIEQRQTITPENYKIENRKLQETINFHAKNYKDIQQDLESLDRLQASRKYATNEMIEQRKQLEETLPLAKQSVLDDLDKKVNLLSIQIDNDDLTASEYNNLTAQRNDILNKKDLIEKGEADIYEAIAEGVIVGAIELAKVADGALNLLGDASGLNDTKNTAIGMLEKSKNPNLTKLYIDKLQKDLQYAPITNDLLTKTLKSATGVFIEYAGYGLLAPGTSLPVLMGTTGGAKAYGESANAYDSQKQRINKTKEGIWEGAKEGLKLTVFGLGSSAAANKLFTGATSRELATHTGVATAFGLDTYAHTGDIEQSVEAFSMGIALSTMGKVKESVSQSVDVYSKVSNEAKEYARSSTKSVLELRAEAEVALKEALATKDKDKIVEANILNNIASVKAFDQYAAKNPLEAKKLILSFDLSNKELFNLNNKIDISVAENQPTSVKILDNDISRLNEQRVDLENNKALGEAIKQVQIKAIDEQIKLKQEEIGVILGVKEIKTEEKADLKPESEKDLQKEDLKEEEYVSDKKEPSTIEPIKYFTKKKPYTPTNTKGITIYHGENGLVLKNKDGRSIEFDGNKPKFYIKNGNQIKKLKPKGESKSKWYEVNKEDQIIKEYKGKVIDKQTLDKAVDDYINNVDLNRNTETDLKGIGQHEEAFKISEESTNPTEIAETYLREAEQYEGNIESISRGGEKELVEFLESSEISIGSFSNLSDKSHLKDAKGKFGEGTSLRRKYLSKDGRPLDTVVEEMMDYLGRHIEIEEAINTMLNNPEGTTSINKRFKNDNVDRLEARFGELTNLPLDKTIAEKIIEKANSNYVSQDIIDKAYAKEIKSIDAFDRYIIKELKKGNLIINEKEGVQDGKTINKESKDAKDKTTDKGRENTESKSDKETSTIQDLRNEVDKIYEIKKEEITTKQTKTKDDMATAIHDLMSNIGGVKSIVGDKKVKTEDAVIRLAKATFELTGLKGLKGQELILEIKRTLSELYPKNKEAIDIELNSRVKAIENAVKDLETPTTVKTTQSIKTRKISGMQKSYSELNSKLNDITKGIKSERKLTKQQKNEIIEIKYKLNKEEAKTKELFYYKKNLITEYLKENKKGLDDTYNHIENSLRIRLNEASTNHQLNKLVKYMDKIINDNNFRKEYETKNKALEDIKKQTSGVNNASIKESLKITNDAKAADEVSLIKFTNEVARKAFNGVKIDKKGRKLEKKGEKRIKEIERLEQKQSDGKTLTKDQEITLAEKSKLDDFGLTEKESSKLEALDAYAEYKYGEDVAAIVKIGENRLELINKDKLSNKENLYNENGLTKIEEAQKIILDTVGRIPQMSAKEATSVAADIKLTVKNRIIEAKEAKIKKEEVAFKERQEVRTIFLPEKTTKEAIKYANEKYAFEKAKLEEVHKIEIEKAQLKELDIKELEKAQQKELSEIEINHNTIVGDIKSNKGKNVTALEEGARIKPNKGLDDLLISDSSWRSLMARLSTNNLDKKTGTYENDLNEITYNKYIQKSERGEVRDIRKFSEEQDKVINELFKNDLLYKYRNDATVKLTVKNKNNVDVDINITQAEAATYYNLLKSAEVTDHLTRPREKGGLNGWGDITIEQLNKQLNPKWKKLADFHFNKYNNELYNYENKVYKLQEGINLLKLENYSPLNAEAIRIEKVEEGKAKTSLKASNRHQIERVNTPVEVKPADLISVYNNHIADAAHYTNWSNTLGALNNMFINSKTKQLIEKEFGTKYYQNVRRFIERFAGDNKVQKFELLDAAINNFTKGALMMSRSVGIKQLISSVMYMSDMSPAAFTANLAKLETTHRGVLELLGEQAFVKNRNSAAFSSEVSKQGKLEDLVSSKRVKKLIMGANAMSKKVGLEKVERVASWNIRAMDKVPIKHAGGAYFLKAMKDSGLNWKVENKKAEEIAHEKVRVEEIEGKSYTEKEREVKIQEYKIEELNKSLAEPLSKWDALSSTTQQSNFISDVSNIRADNSILRAFTVFTSGPSQVHRLAMNGLRDMRKGVKFKNKKLVTRGMGRFALSQAIVPALYTLVGNGMDLDWEKEGKAVILGNIAGVPLGRVFVSIANIVTNEAFGTGSLSPVVDNLYKAVEYMHSASEYKTKMEEAKSKSSKKKYYDKMWEKREKMFYSVATMMGVPVKNAKNIWQDAYNVGKYAVKSVQGTAKKSDVVKNPYRTLLGLDSEWNTGYDVFNQDYTNKTKAEMKKKSTSSFKKIKN